MNIVSRLIQGGVIAGFLISSSGCIVAPDRGGGDRDRVVHEQDRDRHDHDDRRCDDRDEHCHDR